MLSTFVFYTSKTLAMSEIESIKKMIQVHHFFLQERIAPLQKFLTDKKEKDNKKLDEVYGNKLDRLFHSEELYERHLDEYQSYKYENCLFAINDDKHPSDYVGPTTALFPYNIRLWGDSPICEYHSKEPFDFDVNKTHPEHMDEDGVEYRSRWARNKIDSNGFLIYTCLIHVDQEVQKKICSSNICHPTQTKESKWFVTYTAQINENVTQDFITPETPLKKPTNDY